MASPFHTYKTIAMLSNIPMLIDQIMFKHVIQSLVVLCNKLFKENINHILFNFHMKCVF